MNVPANRIRQVRSHTSASPATQPAWFLSHFPGCDLVFPAYSSEGVDLRGRAKADLGT